MFQENFWTHDYISGINALLSSLKSSLQENNRILEFIRSRVVAESETASMLSAAKQVDPQEDGAIQTAFIACIDQTVAQSTFHQRASDELDKYCYEPLANVTQLYAKNLRDAEAILKKQFQGYQRLNNQSTRARNQINEPPQDAEPRTLDSAMSTLRLFREKYSKSTNLDQLLDPRGQITLAGLRYSRSEAVALLQRLTKNVTMISYKVALLGTYEHVSTGAAITSASRRLLKNDSLAYSDKFGQSLVDTGLIKPIAQLTNKFQNSHQSFYQWQPAALDLADEPPAVTLTPPEEVDRAPSPGLAVESETYLQSVIELDVYRCTFEQEIMKVYQFLEQAELDRLTAVKRALFTYQELTLGPLELKQKMPQINTAKAEFDPGTELARFTKRHRSGPFIPTVAVYQGSNNTIVQTFGVELEKTSFITDVFLAQLRDVDVPLSCWTEPYSLDDAYKLRSQVNTGRRFKESIFRFFSAATICATLKQYYLELPESVIPFTVYDAAKHNTDPAQILKSLNNVHYDTLKEILGFLKRYNAPKELGKALAHYLFRPRAVSALTMDDQHPANLISHLLENYDTLFNDERPPSTPDMLNSSSTLAATLLSPHPPSPRENGRPRATSSGTAFETSNGTGLIPLTLSPEPSNVLKKTHGARFDLRHSMSMGNSAFQHSRAPSGSNSVTSTSPPLDSSGSASTQRTQSSPSPQKRPLRGLASPVRVTFDRDFPQGDVQMDTQGDKSKRDAALSE